MMAPACRCLSLAPRGPQSCCSRVTKCGGLPFLSLAPRFPLLTDSRSSRRHHYTTDRVIDIVRNTGVVRLYSAMGSGHLKISSFFSVMTAATSAATMMMATTTSMRMIHTTAVRHHAGHTTSSSAAASSSSVESEELTGKKINNSSETDHSIVPVSSSINSSSSSSVADPGEHGRGSSAAIAAGPHGEIEGGHGGAPKIVASTRDITRESTMLEVVANLEERRVARQKKMFEDLIVFEGGAMSDHPSLGKEMIMRDFVHFGLYHHKWGYYPKLYSKYRQLMTTGYFDPIPFNSLRSQFDFERYAGKLHETTPGFVSPTQLFYPYYGWALAEYLVTTHRAKFDPREPLVVYDIGSGTGALAASILDYLAEHFPAIYEKCEYHALEMNPYLVQILRNRLVHHYHHVHIHHLSALNWRSLEPRRCIVLAIELFSGMPHDVIVWDNKGIVSEQWFRFTQHDNLASAEEVYKSAKDPAILRYLRYLNWLQEESYHALKVLCVTGGRETIDPPPYGSLDVNHKDNLLTMVSKILWIHSPWRTAWLPTAQMLLLEVLAKYFPRHHFFATDWNVVRQALPGINAPVLQVKVRVAKDLYLRRPMDVLHTNAGMVDICFPTDFEQLTSVYRRICGAEKDVSCMTHPEFWKTFGGEKTALFCTKSGFNPLLEDFSQLSVFTAHHSPEY